MRNLLEIQEFFVEGNKEEQDHVLLHITEPSTPEERRRGYFFVLVELSGAGPQHIARFQECIDEMEQVLYESSHPDAEAFDKAIELINKKGHHLLSGGVTVHCLIASLRRYTLKLAVHGSPSAFLRYQKEETGGLVPIAETSESQTKAQQLFSELVEGTVRPGDTLYFATPSVAGHFSADRVQKLTESRTVRQTAEHMETVLKDIGGSSSYGGILIHIPPHMQQPDERPRAPAAAPEQKKSIETPQRTAENMSQNVALPANQATPAKMQNQPEHNFRPREQTEDGFLNTLIIALGRALVTGLFGLWRLAKYCVLGLIRLLVGLILIASNKDNKRGDVLSAWRGAFVQKKEWIASLPLFSKVLAALALLCILVFAGSLAGFRYKEAREQKQLAYRQTVQAISDKKDAAEARLIYGDDLRALELLDEAKTMLPQLATDTDEQKAQYEALDRAINASLQKLQKMTTAEVRTVATLPAEALVADLAVIGETLLAFGPESTVSYAVDTANGSVSQVTHAGVTGLRSASTPKEQDMVVFVTAQGSIAVYNPSSKSIVPRDIAFPANENTLSGIFVYNRALYTLVPNQQQIYKHNMTQTGFDKGSAWLKGSADLSGAASLAIDGDVFVLTGTALQKFTKGEKQPFEIQGLTPALTAASRVWTYNDVDEIFILEPAGKRVIILDKEGKLVTQYTSEHWKQPSGMVVDSEQKTIYILDTGTVYSFTR